MLKCILILFNSFSEYTEMDLTISSFKLRLTQKKKLSAYETLIEPSR